VVPVSPIQILLELWEHESEEISAAAVQTEDEEMLLVIVFKRLS
jgi:hypothetical protein